MVIAAALASVAALLAGNPDAAGVGADCRAPVAQAHGAPRLITPDDLARLRDIGTPDSSLSELPSPLALSPDGRHVAFVVSRGDPATNATCRLLMVAEIVSNATPRVLDTGGELITLRYAVHGSMVSVGYPDVVVPSWSPDGRSIGYLRRDRGITQLWRVSNGGGDATPITHSAVDIEAWAWLSNTEVVVASKPGQAAEDAKIDAEGKAGWLYDTRFVPHHGARPQMRGDLPRQFLTVDLTTLTTRVATAREVAHVEPEAEAGVPASPRSANRRGDRTWLEPDGPSPVALQRLQFIDRTGHRTRCNDASCAGRIVTVAWSADESAVVYLRREGWANSRSAFYSWTPGGGTPKRLSVTDDLLLGCVKRSARFLCLRETSTSTRRIVEVDSASGHWVTIYDPNPEFAAIDLGAVRRLELRNDRGLAFWADLVLPPGYRGGKKLPVVVVQYASEGFLRGGTGDEYPVFPMAARGFAVLSIDRPPSVVHALADIKTADDFNRAETKDWAERRSHLSATLTAVDKAIALGIADPQRIGITGLSDGASNARFALINSRVFSVAAISSSSFEPNTIITHSGIALADYYRGLGYPPATADNQFFWKPYSLALNARDINVPLLIQASDDEYLLSLETFTALREHDKAVELYVFPGEHHIKSQPVHRLAVYERNIDWFAFWLQDRIDPSPAKATQYARWKAMRDR